ncbi:unnamed protein product [Leptosia nina]|uniref:Uncharacterized protein n=1 Tax=Leptosia nina TaxID=320188 RepID=A0AAV1JSE4_9NEOP
MKRIVPAQWRRPSRTSSGRDRPSAAQSCARDSTPRGSPRKRVRVIMKHETMIFRVVGPSARRTTSALRSRRAPNKYTLLLSINNLQLEAGPVSRRNYSNKKLKPVQIKDKMVETEELNGRRQAIRLRCTRNPSRHSVDTCSEIVSMHQAQIIAVTGRGVTITLNIDLTD